MLPRLYHEVKNANPTGVLLAIVWCKQGWDIRESLVFTESCDLLCAWRESERLSVRIEFQLDIFFRPGKSDGVQTAQCPFI